MAASMSHHSWQSRKSVGVQTDANPVDEYVAPAPAPYAATAGITQLLESPISEKFEALVSADTYTSLSHMTEYVAPAPADCLLHNTSSCDRTHARTCD